MLVTHLLWRWLRVDRSTSGKGGVEKLGQCCLEDIRDYKHGGKDH
ncbi:hypothetical protein RchiOBHm_Chr7g0238331 [Rosa chinensis]|uniref:Uncharacterized protein n=1 Tax=Rosa chinensis TaxID=74649 RepID=A0A2P6PHH2_ROSCH|nr:hypothetical protein RchiOBHm_Chr7g0238331 [Rosa chinensis]